MASQVAATDSDRRSSPALSADAYGTRLWFDGQVLTVEATGMAGHGALGAARRDIALGEISGLTVTAPTMLRNGSMTVATRSGTTVVHFRPVQADGIAAIHEALHRAATQTAASGVAQHEVAMTHAATSGTVSVASPAQTEPPSASPIVQRHPGAASADRAGAVRLSAQWIPPGQRVRVGAWTLPGMLFVGDRLPAPTGTGTDPALIVPTLAVDAARPDWAGESLDYWPSYSELQPNARAAYLGWLADGRRSPHVAVGYVFLFFYGLERRVLVDALGGDAAAAGELPQIRAEVARLLDLYGSNRSFHGYATEFLEVVDLLTVAGSGSSTGAPPDVPDVKWPISMRLSLGLGEMARQGRPVPVDWALVWALSHPQIHPGTAATRCREEFGDLFRQRYRARHGDGLLVRPSAELLTVRYRPASAGFSGRVTAPIGDLPDVVELAGPTAALRELVESCTGDLAAYSKLLGREPRARGTLPAAAVLPAELMVAACPEVGRLTGWIRSTLDGRSSAVVDGAELLGRWGVPSGTKATKRDVTGFAQLLSRCGYGVEPDVRMGGPALGPGPAVVFVADGAPVATAGPAYAAATILLHLATAVAAADGTIDESEQLQLVTHLETSLELTSQERARLRAHLRWLAGAGAKLTGLRARIDVLTPSQREVIARFVVRIAAADGVIAPAEVTTVTKIYKLLGLDAGTVPADLHAAAAPARPRPAVEPVVVRAGTASGGYAVPARSRGRHAGPASDAPGTMLELDPALIEAKLAETSVVAELLTAIFTDDEPTPTFAAASPVGPAEPARGGPYPALHEHEAGLPPAVPAAPAAPVAPATEPGPSAGGDVAGLDAAHTRLLRALAQRPSWSRAEYEDLAERGGLLPDGALDRLNEAAYELLGEPFLEGDDPLSINDDAREMLA